MAREGQVMAAPHPRKPRVTHGGNDTLGALAWIGGRLHTDPHECTWEWLGGVFGRREKGWGGRVGGGGGTTYS